MKLIATPQGIFSSITGARVGSEMLARWYVPPDVILGPSDLEQIDWGRVDMEMADQVLKFAALQNSQFLFLNVSMAILESKSFQAWLTKVRGIQEAGEIQCVIEITESIPRELLLCNWTALKNTGAKLAMDDFGTEFSNLKRLIEYRWDFCKVDARRLAEMETECAIRICRASRIQVIAECVENERLFEKAVKAGVYWHQGFYLEVPTLPAYASDQTSNQVDGNLAC